MLINRDNYEMYFLLYVDEELSTAERKALLLFLQDNPDLKQELHQWQETKLIPPSEISFQGKNLLYRHEAEDAVLNEDNFEEYCLLYVDGELSEPNKRALEHYAAANPGRLARFDLFLQTKFYSDQEIVFANKTILYRTEKTRIVPFYIIRFAAACLLLMLAGWVVFSIYLKKDQTLVPSAIAGHTSDQKIHSPEKKEEIKVTSAKGESLYLKNLERRAESSTERAASAKSLIAKTISNTKPTERSPKNKLIIRDSSSAELAAATVTEQVIPAKEMAQLVQVSEKNDFAASSKTAPNAKPLHLDEGATDQSNDQISKEPVQEEGLNLMAFTEKKNRMRGVFRRVSRVLDKTANGNETSNKRGVLIGSFQIALK